MRGTRLSRSLLAWGLVTDPRVLVGRGFGTSGRRVTLPTRCTGTSGRFCPVSSSPAFDKLCSGEHWKSATSV